MPCDRAHAQAELKRLRGLPVYGDRDDHDSIRREVGEMLVCEAVDDAHATRIVTGLLRRMTRYPTPADLLAEAEGTRQPPVYGGYRTRCGLCGGTGFRFTMAEARAGVYAGERYSAVVRCDCHPSRAASRADTEDAWRG